MNRLSYADYKDSGAEWLGEVPSHWTVTRIGALFREVVEEGEEGLPILSVSIHNGVSDKELDEKEAERKVTRSEDATTYKAVRPDDLVYNMMRAWQGAFGAVQVAGMVSPAYVVARPTKEFLTRYVELVLRTLNAVEEMRRHSQGVTDFRLRLYWDEFKTIRVALPPLAEQAAVLSFLDRETARIDSLVGEQERLIALVKEKRQAVISHAVTKGLDPTAPMKDSGIDWLGEVPEHWNLLRVKHTIHAVEQGWSPQCDGFAAEPDEWGVLKVGCVNGGVFNPGENKRLPDDLDPIPELSIKLGDVLISRANTRELVGGVAIASKDFPKLLLCDKLYRLRTHDDICNPAFLARYLMCGVARAQIELAATGASSSMLNIAQSTILDMSIAVPSLAEQVAIVAYLETETAKLDALVAEAERAIDLLREHRAALISAAVTGKIDVRGLVDMEAA